MYNHLKPHTGEYRWGRYFPFVPDLPVTEPGRPFRFAFVSGNHTMDDLVANLEHSVSDVTITTKYDLNWSVDGSVAIGDKLYKIQDGITSEVIQDQSNALTKSIRQKFTIRLMEISNPIGLRAKP